MYQKLLKELQKELLVAHKNFHKIRWEKNFEKNKARLTYEKLQLIRSRKPTTAVEAQLKAMDKGEIDYPPMDEDKAEILVGSSQDVANLQNVLTFLKNQREYNELIERYNPGLRMSQEDNVRKSANRVGLTVPDN